MSDRSDHERSDSPQSERSQSGSAPSGIASEPDSPKRSTPLGVIFLTLFLDLVGFSIIFPLFPAILDEYQDDPQLQSLLNFLRQTFAIEDARDPRVQALFGGVLGSIYSLLQFLASPIWGRWSDRVGRKPILSITVAGIGASYLLWAFSASFTLLVISRFIAGLMAGNIATATAAVSDVTSRAERAKGMGIIGAAFGLGFILGPAIGGGLSLIDLTELYPSLAAWGMHPFSACALGAGLLSFLNWIWIRKRFRETYPPLRRVVTPPRSPLPRIGFGGQFGSAVLRTNLGNFMLLLAFSGIEFTLSFLVRDRFQWKPPQIAGMFVHIGLVLAVVQGGLVRRLAPRYGEKRLALVGLALVAFGLVGIAVDQSRLLFWLSLTALAGGSGLCFPSLSALVSLHASESSQGEALGIFRGLGALARAIGPFAAAILYWQYGPAIPYWSGAISLLIPFWIIATVPRPPR